MWYKSFQWFRRYFIYKQKTTDWWHEKQNLPQFTACGKNGQARFIWKMAMNKHEWCFCVMSWNWIRCTRQATRRHWCPYLCPTGICFWRSVYVAPITLIPETQRALFQKKITTGNGKLHFNSIMRPQLSGNSFVTKLCHAGCRESSNQTKQVVKVIWHKTASPPHMDGSIVFARWCQCAAHIQKAKK